ncbi:response regulator transcription factor [Paeniglutamicibacter antarcticus]|uniref:Response regulator transcription factor n=1 Tax=Arthrobacter terrae TaxID=2935737 RepID=A0A931G958_9MICC|nr:response regulator transcription factor [Arthrobacter terrae]MBG0740864.1 response regulator transcription factor [Arthrobacter terrae]
MTDGKLIRVHLVSADFLLQQGLQTILTGLDYVTLEAVSRTAEDAFTAVVAAGPDIVLIERGLPGIDGVAEIRAITEQAPRTKVVLLCAETDRKTMIEAYQAGAVSFLTKTQMTQDLGPALRMIHRGAAIFAMPLSSPRLQTPGATESADNLVLKAQFNSRDRKLLAGVAAGRTNAQIGRDLHLSEATIKAQLTGIMTRLNVSNRVQLAVAVVRNGLVDMPVSHAPGP